jgi:hypothetical protein
MVNIALKRKWGVFTLTMRTILVGWLRDLNLANVLSDLTPLIFVWLSYLCHSYTNIVYYWGSMMRKLAHWVQTCLFYLWDLKCLVWLICYVLKWPRRQPDEKYSKRPLNWSWKSYPECQVFSHGMKWAGETNSIVIVLFSNEIRCTLLHFF